MAEKRVTDKNGTVHVFPDDATEAEIAAILGPNAAPVAPPAPARMISPGAAERMPLGGPRRPADPFAQIARDAVGTSNVFGPKPGVFGASAPPVTRPSAPPAARPAPSNVDLGAMDFRPTGPPPEPPPLSNTNLGNTSMLGGRPPQPTQGFGRVASFLPDLTAPPSEDVSIGGAPSFLDRPVGRAATFRPTGEAPPAPAPRPAPVRPTSVGTSNVIPAAGGDPDVAAAQRYLASRPPASAPAPLGPPMSPMRSGGGAPPSSPSIRPPAPTMDPDVLAAQRYLSSQSPSPLGRPMLPMRSNEGLPPPMAAGRPDMAARLEQSLRDPNLSPGQRAVYERELRLARGGR